jgi:hypothetical protein
VIENALWFDATAEEANTSIACQPAYRVFEPWSVQVSVTMT